VDEVATDDVARELAAAAHTAIKKVSEDIDPRFQFNTAIAALMELVNVGTKLIAGESDALSGDVPAVRLQAARCFVQVAAGLTQPFAPHVTSELWSLFGGDSLVTTPWPTYDEAYLTRDTVTIAVQVGGKLRATIEVPADASKDDIIAAARADAKVATHLENTRTVKEIVVPGRLVNLVVAPA
jgi:leucyl-tRNA synthetase